ncbi:hypothetical protein GCM10027268_02870 [Brachybacterium huguangmaarense]
MIRYARDIDGGDVPSADRRRWLGRLEEARVVGRCPCGTCPTIDLSSEKSDPARRIVLSATADGLGILLFVDDDRVTCLEGYPLHDDQECTELPPAGALAF